MLVFGSAAVSALLLPGCAARPLSAYDLDVPAQVLRVPTAPAVADGRPRFREIFCASSALAQEDPEKPIACEQFLLRLSDEAPPPGLSQPASDPARRLRVVLVGGLLSDCVGNVVAVYAEASRELRALGYQVELVPVGGQSSSRRNAQQVADFLSHIDLEPQEELVLIGHSKGALDILQFVVDHPDALARVAAVVSIAGAVNGSPLAEWAADPARSWLKWLPSTWCTPGDAGAWEDLKRSRRMDWWARNRLPDSVRYYSVVAFTGIEETAWPLQQSHRLLSYVDPRNDGQLVFYDQVIPGGTLLGYANTDHWGIALSLESMQTWLALRPDRVPPFPRAALLQAVLLYIAEDLQRRDYRSEAQP